MTNSLYAIKEAVRRAPLMKPEGLSPEWQAYFDAVTPLHVAALIAALEQAQAQSSKWLEAYHKAVLIGARYEERIAELESSVIAPGIMRCAKCEFVLTKNSINMAAGTITAGDSKTEPCPNGCGPLWPVTWREQALEMRDSSEQWFDELQAAKNRIAELEVACDRNYIDGMKTGWNYCDAGNSDGFNKCVEQRRKGISEAKPAEVRQLSVKLPPRKTADDYVDGEFTNEELAMIYNTCRLECGVKIINAGGTVEGEQ